MYAVAPAPVNDDLCEPLRRRGAAAPRVVSKQPYIRVAAEPRRHDPDKPGRGATIRVQLQSAMLESALSAAVEAAVQAGEILRADFHRRGGPRGSGDKAEADIEAEREIRARLLDAFRGWGYRGEETGVQAGDPGQPTWVVDPNDGTRDYLVGRRGSAVSIGLIRDGMPVLGVVFAFAYPDDHGDLFAWAEGAGPLQRNKRPLDVTLARALGHEEVVLVSSKGDRDPEGNLRNASPARYRSLASIAHRLALVASGEAAGATSLFAPCAWDYGAGDALVRASRGRVVDESGRTITYDATGDSHSARAFAGSPDVAGALAGRLWDVHAGPWGSQRPAKLQPGRAIADAARLARAQGCLLGQIAGDSLGALVEFATADEVRHAYPDGPRRLVDGGHWDLLAGQPTDDSEMALALARSIVERGGYDPSRAMAAYRGWLASSPFDIGHTVSAALHGRPTEGSQANGSLMRASPLGVLAHRMRAAEAAALGRADSALTHPNPVCGDAVAAFVVAVAHAIDHGDGGEAAHDAALSWAREARAEPIVLEALRAAAHGAPECDGASQGWVKLALQNAFYEVRHARSVEEGLARTVLRGGDTDTNAAIAGALLGAVHGREGLPAQWRSMVLSCHPIAGFARHPRPMAFWPVDAMELSELLLLAGEG
jgi:ADP-ribosylglycohydrolase/fructose-1,6-bisphosphatase/inositol monophosphatase family enzyme